jgi:hypothetical protein
MMETAFESDLRRHLESVFQNRMSVAEFRQWFMSAWWSAETSASDSELRLGSRIENLLYILDAGEWSEDQFCASLSDETADFMRSFDPSARFPVAS